MSHCQRSIFLIASTGLLTAPTVASITLLGNAPGTVIALGTGISADGTVAAGYTSTGSDYQPGFIWSAAQGRYDFGLEPGLPATTAVAGLSGDGTTVVGNSWSQAAPDQRAFRWRTNPSGGPGSFQNLGTIGTARSYAQGTNQDGSVVVGHVETGSGLGITGQPFIWTQSGGMVGLAQYLPSQFYGEARAVSRDGSTVVGTFLDSASGGSNAFTFSNGQASVLSQLPGTNGNHSLAIGVNFNGSVIVGSSGFNNRTAAIWRDGVPEAALPLAPGYGNSALGAVDDAGNVAVGTFQAITTGTILAAIWTPARGMEPLADYLVTFGMVLPAGWIFREATGVSADGLTIVGSAVFPGVGEQAFVAHVPSPATAALVLAGCLATRRSRWR